MKDGITVIRTAVGSPPAMSLVNELKGMNIRVIGTDCNPLSSGLHLCDKGYITPRGDDTAFIDKMLEICKSESADAIISGPEEELLTLSKNKQLFEDVDVLVLCPDYKTVKICADKKLTDETFESLDIPKPKIYEMKEIRYPCILKPKFGRGGKMVYKINNQKELDFYINKVEDPIVQEFVGGMEYTIDTFADKDGNPLSIIPRIRLQIDSGISIKGRTVYDEEMIGYCEKIVKNLKLAGPACVQCIKNKEGIKFIEVNPRFGGGSILSIKADPTIMENLIKIIKNKTPSKSKGFEEGLIMLRYYSEVFVHEKGCGNSI